MLRNHETIAAGNRRWSCKSQCCQHQAAGMGEAYEIDSPAADTATDDVAAAADETQAEESSEAAREVRQTPHNTILRII